MIHINAILAHDLKKLQDVKTRKNVENQQLEVNGWEECDKAIIHSKELTKTETLEKQLAEAREEKGDLENYAVHEIKKTHVKLTNHRIENEDRQRQILNGESGIICDSSKVGKVSN